MDDMNNARYNPNSPSGEKGTSQIGNVLGVSNEKYAYKIFKSRIEKIEKTPKAKTPDFVDIITYNFVAEVYSGLFIPTEDPSSKRENTEESLKERLHNRIRASLKHAYEKNKDYVSE